MKKQIIKITTQLVILGFLLSLFPYSVMAEGETPEIPIAPQDIEVLDLESQSVSDSGITQLSVSAVSPAVENQEYPQPFSSMLEVKTSSLVDPWFTCTNDTIDGVTDGICQYTAIQSAINDFFERGGSGLITLETGTFTEDVSISNVLNLTGLAGENLLSPSQIIGSVTIQTQTGFVLQNLAIQGGISINNSSGDLVFTNLQVSNPVGNGIQVKDHNGNISLDSISSTGNLGFGVQIRNSSDSVIIRNSTFNDNQTGASILTSGYVFIDSSQMNDNQTLGLEILNAASVYVASSEFSHNLGNGVAGIGILAKGPITLDEIRASSNTGDGVLIFSFENDINILKSTFNNNGMYGIRLFWPSETLLTLSRVTACDNKLGAAFMLGDDRVGSINSCTIPGELENLQAGISNLRTLIINNNIPVTNFLQNLPTQVLVQNETSDPPQTLAKLLFPSDSAVSKTNIRVSLLQPDLLTNPPTVMSDWIGPIIEIIMTAGDGSQPAEIQPAFSICFTEENPNIQTEILFQQVNRIDWVSLETTAEGDQVCVQSTLTGIFVLSEVNQ